MKEEDRTQRETTCEHCLLNDNRDAWLVDQKPRLRHDILAYLFLDDASSIDVDSFSMLFTLSLPISSKGNASRYETLALEEPVLRIAPCPLTRARFIYFYARTRGAEERERERQLNDENSRIFRTRYNTTSSYLVLYLFPLCLLANMVERCERDLTVRQHGSLEKEAADSVVKGKLDARGKFTVKRYKPKCVIRLDGSIVSQRIPLWLERTRLIPLIEFLSRSHRRFRPFA